MIKVFLDVDDTLNNFAEYAQSRGVPPWSGTWYMNPKETWTEEQQHINDLTVELMEGDDFWPNIPVKDGAQLLISTAKRVGDVSLLTAYPAYCSNIDNIVEQKLKYCERVFGFSRDNVIVCDRRDKIQYAKDINSILVDDAEKNCKEWTEAGGRAIQFKGIAETIKQLMEIVEYVSLC